MRLFDLGVETVPLDGDPEDVGVLHKGVDLGEELICIYILHIKISD